MNAHAGIRAPARRLLFAGALSLSLHAFFFGLGLGLFHSSPNAGRNDLLVVDIADPTIQGRGAEEDASAVARDPGGPAAPPRAPGDSKADAVPKAQSRGRSVAPLSPASMTAAAAKTSPSPVSLAPPSPVAASAGEARVPGIESGAPVGGESAGAVGGSAAAGEGFPSLSGPEAGNAAGTGDAERAFFGRIREAIDRHKQYPQAARMRGTEGTVRVHLSISAEGRLMRVELASSSGSSLLDRAALDLVASVFPMSNPTGRKLDPVLAVSYSLTR
ncbi:MAG: TonB family protein [Rectinemataceae bacterium]